MRTHQMPNDLRYTVKMLPGDRALAFGDFRCLQDAIKCASNLHPTYRAWVIDRHSQATVWQQMNAKAAAKKGCRPGDRNR